MGDSKKNDENIFCTEEDIEKLVSSLEKAKKESNSPFKPLEELLIIEKFRVDAVQGTSYQKMVSPDSEMEVGGSYSSYPAGYATVLELKVTSLSQEKIPIQVLSFHGNSPVVKGDVINALIPKYDEVPSVLGGKSSYKERDYTEKETIFQIDILASDGEVKRSDISALYKKK